MKKLRCKSYLNQPGITREQLYLYTDHLFNAHGRSLPNVIMLAHLACSELSLAKAYEEVDALVQQVNSNYSKRGQI